MLFRDDVTMDQFIDVLDRNKSYVPMLVLLNKVDLVDDAYIKELKNIFLISFRFLQIKIQT